MSEEKATIKAAFIGGVFLLIATLLTIFGSDIRNALLAESGSIGQDSTEQNLELKEPDNSTSNNTYRVTKNLPEDPITPESARA